MTSLLSNMVTTVTLQSVMQVLTHPLATNQSPATLYTHLELNSQQVQGAKICTELDWYLCTTVHLRQLLYKLYYTAAAEQHIIIKQRRGDGKLSSEFHTYLNWSRTEEILEMTELLEVASNLLKSGSE